MSSDTAALPLTESPLTEPEKTQYFCVTSLQNESYLGNDEGEMPSTYDKFLQVLNLNKAIRAKNLTQEHIRMIRGIINQNNKSN